MPSKNSFTSWAPPCGSVSASAALAQLLVGQHLAALQQVAHDRLAVVGRQRPDVLAVDRGHRRDVARAEALEAAHVEARVAAGGLEHRRVDVVGAAQRARDVRAHVDACARPWARCRTCRRTSRPRSGTRASGASRRRPARSRSASTSRASRWTACSAGSTPSAGRGTSPCAPRSRRAAPSGTGVVAGSGTTAGSFVRSTASSQPGTREPCAKRLTCEGSIAMLSGRSRPGPGRASPASRSGRRCRGPGPSA